MHRRMRLLERFSGFCTAVDKKKVINFDSERVIHEHPSDFDQDFILFKSLYGTLVRDLKNKNT